MFYFPLYFQHPKLSWDQTEWVVPCTRSNTNLLIHFFLYFDMPSCLNSCWLWSMLSQHDRHVLGIVHAHFKNISAIENIGAIDIKLLVMVWSMHMLNFKMFYIFLSGKYDWLVNKNSHQIVSLLIKESSIRFSNLVSFFFRFKLFNCGVIEFIQNYN